MLNDPRSTAELVETITPDRERESHARVRPMLAERSDDEIEVRSEDSFVYLRDASWKDFQFIVELRGERSAPKLAFLDGVIELMSPSRPHEGIKSWIGCLVEVWCEERDIEYSTYGAWLLENAKKKTALEPDECYVFGDNPLRLSRPQLAIEVIWTSGSLDKLEIYRQLGVPEVWFWKNGKITIHVLRGDTYKQARRSDVLRGIDLTELVSFLDRPTTSRAKRDYRAALQAQKRRKPRVSRPSSKSAARRRTRR